MSVGFPQRLLSRLCTVVKRKAGFHEVTMTPQEVNEEGYEYINAKLMHGDVNEKCTRFVGVVKGPSTCAVLEDAMLTTTPS